MESTRPRCYICYRGAENEPLVQRGCACRGDGLTMTHVSCAAAFARSQYETLQTTLDYMTCRTCWISYGDELESELARRRMEATAHLAVDHADRMDAKLNYARRLLFDDDSASTLPLLLELRELCVRNPSGAAGMEMQLKCALYLATAYANLQQQDEAERVLQPALALLECTDGVREELYLWAKRTIATVFVKLGRLEESKCVLQDLLSAYAEQPATQRKATSSILHRLDLAAVLLAVEKNQEALPVLQKLLPDVRRVYGPCHKLTAEVYNLLSTVCLNLGMFTETVDLLRGVEALDVNLEETRNVDALLLCHLLGLAHLKLCNYAEAERLFRVVVPAFTRLTGEKSENTLSVEGNLAFTLHKLGRLEESEGLYRRLLAVECQQYGEWHSTTQCTRGMFAFTLMQAAKFSEAEALLVCVWRAQVEDGGEENPALFVTTTNLAHCLSEQVSLLILECLCICVFRAHF